MKNAMVFCMAATPFRVNGELDESALRSHLNRLIDSGVGIYLGSGGAGESHALSMRELRRVYEVGVEVCRGRTPVYANPPEPRTGAAMLQMCKEAVAAGIEVVQLYCLDAGHAMRPTYDEQERYYRDLLDALDHRIALSAHAYTGYFPPIPLFQKLCAEYPQIVAVNVIQTPIKYLVNLSDAVKAVKPDVQIYTDITDLIQGLALGSSGCVAAEPNIIPRLCRSVVEHYRAGDVDLCGAAFANVIRFQAIAQRWAPSTARWVKMAMKVLDLPGGNEGRLRKPYLLPPEAELNEMAKAFDQMRVRELEGLQ